jgi:peptide/nickel transport system substrate-binding protein
MPRNTPDETTLVEGAAGPETQLSRRELVERAAALGLALGGAGALATVGASEAAGAVGSATAQPSTLKFRGAAGIGNLDPGDWSNIEDFIAGLSIFEGLIGFAADTKWKLQNRAAESVEVSSNGLRYQFKLKQGVQFHGGYGELTSADVKFSYERLKKEPHAYSFEFDALDRVQTNGKYAGTIILKERYVPFMSTALPWIPGGLVSQKAVKELGKKFSSNPIGTGPYEFERYVPGQKLVLTRFADWHGSSRPLWDSVELLSIADDTAATNAFLTGALDMGVAPIADVDHLSDSKDFQVVKRTGLNYSWIGMNVIHPNLKDINLRRAIRSAIDVPSILEAAFDNLHTRAKALLAPGMSVGYWKNAPTYNRDLNRARAFLARAKSRPDLEFTVFDITGGAKTVGEIVQANLADIGLKVTLVSRPYGTGIGKQMRDNQLFFMQYAGTAPDPNSATVWFSCGQAKDLYNLNYWCDPRYSAMNNAAVKDLNRGRRNAAYIRMQQIMDRSASSVWVAWPAQYDVVPKGVNGGLLPDGTPLLWAFKGA